MTTEAGKDTTPAHSAPQKPAHAAPADEALWWSRTMDRLNVPERERLASLLARLAESEARRDDALRLAGEAEAIIKAAVAVVEADESDAASDGEMFWAETVGPAVTALAVAVAAWRKGRGDE